MTAALILLSALNVVTLDEAVRLAEKNQPLLTQARGNAEAAKARQGEALSPLLPQATATATYQRTTSNALPSVGSGFSIGTSMGSTVANPYAISLNSYDLFRVNVAITQLVWDFGLTLDHYRAAKETALSLADTNESIVQTTLQNVRAAFFTARANKDLVGVAQKTLENRNKHLTQIEGFVKVGTHPEIDLAQAKADQANARVQLIQATNGYATARAQLNQAMGVMQGVDYEVADDTLPAVRGEDSSTEDLFPEALKARPDVASLTKQVRAQELTISSARGAYFPSISAGLSVTDQATDQNNGLNGAFNLTVVFPFFQGLLTVNTVKEARANLVVVEGQLEQARLQARLDVETARLAVVAAKETVIAAKDVLINSNELLRLAEGRYTAGVGNVIELSDAQVAATSSAAQVVQAEYSLSTARAQLLRALGRR